MKRNSDCRRGFTLTELVVVIAIVALLAGIVIPVVTSQIDDSKKAQAMGDMDAIARAFTTFRKHTNMWPNDPAVVAVPSMTTSVIDFVGFPCLYANTQNLANWKGPYLENGYMNGSTMQAAAEPTVSSAGGGMLDPWGQPYRIYTFAQANGCAGGIILVSRGPDGTFNSNTSQIQNGSPAGDDIVDVISRRL